MKQTASATLRTAFRDELALFLVFIEETSQQPGGRGIREGIVDDPYWNTWLQWQGRMIGMERMLLAAGVRRASIEKDKEVLPEAIRSFEPRA